MNSKKQREGAAMQKMMAQASRFRDAAERRSFWSMVIITLISAAAVFVFNFVL